MKVSREKKVTSEDMISIGVNGIFLTMLWKPLGIFWLIVIIYSFGREQNDQKRA